MRKGAILLAAVAVLVLVTWLVSRLAPPTDTAPDATSRDRGPSATRSAPDRGPATREAPGAEEAVADEPSGPVSITGDVKTHGEGWPPVAGATIRAWPVDGEDRRTGPVAAEAVTEADGRFVLEVPGPGRYGLLALAPDHGLDVRCVTTPAAEVTFILRPGRRVEVAVVDVRDRPVAGAVVVRRPGEGDVGIETSCDAVGRATIDWSTFDEIGARAPGMRATVRRRRPPDDAPLVLRLRPIHGIAGTVTDEDGDPVVGAFVGLDHDGPGTRHVRTGPRGVFLFEGVIASTRTRLVAGADGFASHHRVVVPGDREVRITLLAPRVLRGRVIDADGGPVAEAYVTLGTRFREDETVSDDTGAFRFERLEPLLREATLEVQDGSGERRKTVSGPFEPDRPIEIVLEETPRSWIVLEIVDEDGKPREHVRCQTGGGSARTDAKGRAAVAVRRPAGSEIPVFFTGHDPEFGFRRWTRTLVTVPGEDVPPQRVTVPGERDVRVVVTGADGREIEGAEVEVVPFEGPTPRSTEPGRFRLVEGVVHRVVARAPGHVPETRVLSPAEGTDVVRIVLRRGARLIGRARPGAKLAVEGMDVGEVGKEGRFEVTVPAGRVRVAVRNESRVLVSHADVEVGAGEMHDLGALDAVETREVSGVVTDGRGRPLGGAIVVARSNIPGEPWHDAATRADGAFRFRVPVAGAWELVAAKEGRAAAHRALDGQATTSLRLACPPGDAVLRVRLRVRAGVTITLHLRFPGREVRFRWPLQREWAEGEDEITEYAGLAPGPLDVVLSVSAGRHLGGSDPGGAPPADQERTVRLRAGTATEMTFVVE